MRAATSDERIGEILLGAEQRIALIDRVAPRNLSAERARMQLAFSRGEPAEPEFSYAPVPELSRTRAALAELVRTLEAGGVLGKLYASRAVELDLEAALVEALGTPAFLVLSRKRFDPDRLCPPERTAELVRSWASAVSDVSDEELVMSDDERHPRSLLNVLRRGIGVSREPVRIEIRRELATVAAAGDDVVLIRPGVKLPVHRAERIALHELAGHVLPRRAARKEAVALFRTGASGCAEHEEGRALLLEESSGLLDAARRRELAQRHRAAELIRSGADCTSTVRALCDEGASLDGALEMALRAARGGGLAREIVYLPAYLEVRAEFSARPELEGWFRRGRMSVAAAQVLMEAMDPFGALLL